MYDISLVLPVHNEVESICERVDGILETFEGVKLELIIVEDGCTDGTTSKVEDLSRQKPDIVHIHSEKRLGKGKAIEKGFEVSKGKVVGFVDSDLSIKPGEILQAYQKVLSGEKIVIGSRYLDESETNRKKSRLYPSKAYNLFVRQILGTSIADHQCGLKMFQKEIWEDIEEVTTSSGWFWDTEVIYRAQKNGHKIREVGIEWSESGSSSIGIGDTAKMLENALYLRIEDSKLPFDRRFIRFTAIGIVGAFLNTSLLYFLSSKLNIHYIVSSVAAIEFAIVSMFFLNNKITFEKSKRGIDIFHGILKSNIVRSVGIVANIGLLYLFTEYLGIYFIFSNILAIAAASIINFIGEKRFNWKV